MNIRKSLFFLAAGMLFGCSALAGGFEAADTPTANTAPGDGIRQNTPTITLRPSLTADVPPAADTPTVGITEAAGMPDAAFLVLNGGFEEGADAPDNWSQGAWDPSRSRLVWERESPQCDSTCVSITNREENDAQWSQTIRVVPDTLYTLSGRIKGENIQKNREIGANLFAGNGFNHSDPEGFTGNFDWKTASMTFLGPPEGVITIGCRLGFFGSTVTGTAYFDDISVRPDTDHRMIEGRNVILYLEHVDAGSSVIRPERLSEWAGQLDQAYDEYVELVGTKPFGGNKIRVLSVRAYPGGWAVAGNPILWHELYVRDELSRVDREGDWSFGILHEIGHDFDIEDRWNFNAEFFANFKMYYVVVRLGAKVSPDLQQYYTGAQLMDFYRAGVKADDDYWDDFNIHILGMTETLGWEPFRQAFRRFLDLPEPDLPRTRVEKLNRFLDFLTDASGQDARSFFPAEELAWVLNDMRD